MNRYLVPASLLAAVVAAPLAFATPDGDSGAAPAGGNPPATGQGGARFGGRMARLRALREGRAGHFLRALGITDAQRAELQKSREATKSVRDDLFAKLKAIREEAKAEAAKGARTDAMRDATREKVKAAVTAAREAVAPEARRLMGLVTPEQRQMLSERAARHGKTFDDDRLLKVFERLLLRGHRHAKAAANAQPAPQAPVTTPR